MEIWDLYDITKNRTGETIYRGFNLPPGRYHLVVHFWIRNNMGEYLIQKRSDKVDMNKGMWSFTGGSAISGERSEQAVIREVREEIGYSLIPEDINNIHSYFRKDHWVDVFLLEKDILLQEFTTGVEVDLVKYVSRQEIEKMKAAGLFWNLDEIYLAKLFFD